MVVRTFITIRNVMKKLEGLGVNLGYTYGKCRVINSVEDLNAMEYKDILVLPNSDPAYALGVLQAGGIICEAGGKLSHICIVAMEMGIPCVTQVKNAREILSNVEFVSIDAQKGEIRYE